MTALPPALLACAGLVLGMGAGWLLAPPIRELPLAMKRAWRRQGWIDEAPMTTPGGPRRIFVAGACGAAFAVMAVRFGPGAELAAALAATLALLALAMTDATHRLLPDIIVLPFMVLGLLVNLGGLFVPPIEALAGGVIGYGCPWAIARLHHVLTGREGIGQGDIKLLAALGLWLGWRGLFWAALTATLAALLLVLGAGLARRDERMDSIAYGSCLALGGWLALLAGKGTPPFP